MQEYATGNILSYTFPKICSATAFVFAPGDVIEVVVLGKYLKTECRITQSPAAFLEEVLVEIKIRYTYRYVQYRQLFMSISRSIFKISIFAHHPKV